MKKVWAAVAGLVIVVVGAWWVSTNRPRWSTKDPEVLALVERAEAELGKLYYREAQELLEKALAKAPDSFAVRYFLGRTYSNLGRAQAAAEQIAILKSMPQERLTPREKMLLDLLLLWKSGDREAYLARLAEYQRSYPREVELVRLLAGAYQRAGQPEEAERWGRKLLELDANDALAYNILGYAELARGRFAQAEEQFRKYAYIAPDQANPHDSLGELFLITGRYEEAAFELQKAIRLNPRFYPAWRHLGDLSILQNRPEELRWAMGELARALAFSPEEAQREEATSLGLLAFFHKNTSLLDEVARALQPPRAGWEYFVVHAAALARSNWAEAEALEASLEEQLTLKAHPMGRLRFLLPLHRAVKQGHWPQALELASSLLERTSFDNVNLAWFRLLAMRFRAEALAGLGREEEAARQMGELRAINPRFPLGS
ncbi:MAG: tetratricopeptide repeat protein [Thermoanaerobaculaceae bacterium]